MPNRGDFFAHRFTFPTPQKELTVFKAWSYARLAALRQEEPLPTWTRLEPEPEPEPLPTLKILEPEPESLPSWEDPVSVFFSVTRPEINQSDYIRRIVRYPACSKAALGACWNFWNWISPSRTRVGTQSTSKHRSTTLHSTLTWNNVVILFSDISLSNSISFVPVLHITLLFLLIYGGINADYNIAGYRCPFYFSIGSRSIESGFFSAAPPAVRRDAYIMTLTRIVPLSRMQSFSTISSARYDHGTNLVTHSLWNGIKSITFLACVPCVSASGQVPSHGIAQRAADVVSNTVPSNTALLVFAFVLVLCIVLLFVLVWNGINAVYNIAGRYGRLTIWIGSRTTTTVLRPKANV